MRNNWAIVVIFTSLWLVSSATAAELAYVEWTSSGVEGKPAEWGYNAFDGKTGSAWCSVGDPIGETLTVGYIGDQKIDEIGIVVGSIVKGALDKSRARVRVLQISDGRTKLTLTLKDSADMQVIKLRPMLQSRKMAFEVREVYPGERRSSPVCISEIRLRKGTTDITGDVVGRKIRSLTRPRQRLLHLWIDQPGAPERYLTFGLDETFMWVFEPILEGKPTKIYGTWKLTGTHLTLTPKYGKAATLKVRQDRVADGDRVFYQLVLEGEGLHTRFAGTYQSAAEQAR